MAMQGKLVEQRPEEGVVNLLNIKEKKVDELDFEIPDTWKTAHLESITESVATKTYQIKESEVKPEGKYPVISQSHDFFIGFCDDESKLFQPSGKVIIFGDHTTVVKLIDFNFVIGADGVKIFIPNTQIISADFLYYIFKYYTIGLEKKGGYSRHYKFIKNKPIPLPPLAEQKRIVAKIEEVMPFIDRYATAYDKLQSYNTRFPDDLKKSILQMAIQGKLVPQDPNEEPASVLLEKIAKEKQKLIKEGKIKKQKSLPEITEEEIPFDIPESWEWVRIGDISKRITDGEHKTPKRVLNYQGYYLLSARNIMDGRIALDDVDFVNKAEFDIISKRCNPVKGDILISCSGSIGRCCVVDDNNRYVMVRSAAMVSPIACDPVFLMDVIQSPCVQMQIQHSKKQTAQANLFLGSISQMIIPLPPLAEQKRIVAKLDELLSQIDSLK